MFNQTRCICELHYLWFLENKAFSHLMRHFFVSLPKDMFMLIEQAVSFLSRTHLKNKDCGIVFGADQLSEMSEYCQLFLPFPEVCLCILLCSI